jgi:hypothetical protein
MPRVAPRCAAPALAFALLLGGAGGRKTSLTVEDDRRPGFLVEPFCFAGGGVLRFDVSAFRLTAGGKLVAPAKVGVIVRRVDGAATPFATTSAADRAGAVCLITHKQPDDQVVFITGANASFAQTVPSAAAGLYSLIYANCDPGTAASFSLKATLMNPGGAYLSAGDIPLPLIYGAASVLFLAAFVTWQRTLMANAASAHKIHYLMSALCVVRAASVGFEALRYQSIKATGDGYAWATLYYLLTFIKGVMLFSVILLIGTGWSFVKPFLQDRDKKILLAVVPLQVLVNTAMVVVEETPPGTNGWMTWRDILHLLDVICCCAILFPIVWSIRHLREAAEADGKALRTLNKLKLFREFYIMVVCYIYFTRIIVYLVRVTLPCQVAWIAKGARGWVGGGERASSKRASERASERARERERERERWRERKPPSHMPSHMPSHTPSHTPSQTRTNTRDPRSLGSGVTALLFDGRLQVQAARREPVLACTGGGG